MWPHINHMRNICYFHSHQWWLVMLPRIRHTCKIYNIHVDITSLRCCPMFTRCKLFAIFTGTTSWRCCPKIRMHNICNVHNHRQLVVLPHIRIQLSQQIHSGWIAEGFKFSLAWSRKAVQSSLEQGRAAEFEHKVYWNFSVPRKDCFHTSPLICPRTYLKISKVQKSAARPNYITN